MHRILPVVIVMAAIATACQSEPDLADRAADAAAEAADDPATGAGDDPATDDGADGAGNAASEAEQPAAPASDESCDERATALTFGGSVDADKPQGESAYYCVEVPPGQASVTFTLTGLEEDLSMWVAYDTYELVVEGGIGQLQQSDRDGTEDEQVTMEPSAYRGDLIGFDTYADVSPGPYWIEINGPASPFTLTVTGEAT